MALAVTTSNPTCTRIVTSTLPTNMPVTRQRSKSNRAAKTAAVANPSPRGAKKPLSTAATHEMQCGEHPASEASSSSTESCVSSSVKAEDHAADTISRDEKPHSSLPKRVLRRSTRSSAAQTQKQTQTRSKSKRNAGNTSKSSRMGDDVQTKTIATRKRPVARADAEQSCHLDIEAAETTSAPNKRKKVASPVCEEENECNDDSFMETDSIERAKRKQSSQRWLSTPQVTPSPSTHRATFAKPSFSYATPKRLNVLEGSSTKSPSDEGVCNGKTSGIPLNVVDLYPTDHNIRTTCRHCGSHDWRVDDTTAAFLKSYGKTFFDRLKAVEEPIPLPWYTNSDSSSASSSASSKQQGSSRRLNLRGSPHSSKSSLSSKCSQGSSEQTPIQGKNLPKVDKVVMEPRVPTESSVGFPNQPDLTPKMRTILIDWIIELSEHFHFEVSTLHLAISLIDNVLACCPLDEDDDYHDGLQGRRSTPTCSSASSSVSSSRQETKNGGKTGSPDAESQAASGSGSAADGGSPAEDLESKTDCMVISRERFQLLGATCTWIACKIEMRVPPKVEDFAYVSDNIYTVPQIKRMERRVCKALGFSLCVQTPFPYLYEFLRASNECPDPGCPCLETPHVWNMAMYLLELGRLPFAPVTYKPSMLAATAVYLARVTLGIRAKPHLISPAVDPNGFWTPTLQHYTGYTKAELKETVLAVHRYQLAAEESNLKAVFAKYKMRKYHRAALRTVPFKEQLGF